MIELMEPYRVRVVDPIRKTTAEQRQRLLHKADFNLYGIDSQFVLLDFLTDSGLCAMSCTQVAAMMQADESYAGSVSYQRFESRVREIFGFEYIVPTHQGRAAERLMIECLARPGSIVPCNMHFDTTRANFTVFGVEPVDMPSTRFWEFEELHTFKGDMDCSALEQLLRGPAAERVPFILLTVTNNLCGDQPVSMANIQRVRAIADRYNKPLYLDACRFAQNAWFIHKQEPGYDDMPILSIVREMFSYADGCIFSAKKDALAHMGGFFATRSREIAQHAQERLLLAGGFVTYGGMTGRDMESIAVGLIEVLDEDYLDNRMEMTQYLFAKLRQRFIPMLVPAGGHAVYIDATRLLNHLSNEENPGQALAVELYLEGGIRSTRIVLNPLQGPAAGRHIELVRLALPSRVYSTQHLDFAVSVVSKVAERATAIRGLKLLEAPPLLGGFLARFARVGAAERACAQQAAQI